MEEKAVESKDYKYLLVLKSSNESDKQIIEVLKGQGNIKEYIIQAIKYYERGKRTVQGDEEFRKSIENKLKKMEGILEQINRNTGI